MNFILLLGLPEILSHKEEEEVQALCFILNNYNIYKNMLEQFVLDNASNNDTILLELQITIEFDLYKKHF